ncbi:hypothetical protein ACFWYW_58510, partial [Nonomuraea sp. NPDC059023]|uniref:hypothetical protein n=1 Tax=unclassified Nonomuraea TaxID=2593643 RepID=UPI0036C06C06
LVVSFGAVMEPGQYTDVIWHDGRKVRIYPNGDRFYEDELQAMFAGAEERLKQPLKVDDLDELRARVERLRREAR